jgi:uncharacterized protein
MQMVALLLSVPVGVSLGLLGGGGSTLAVPLLVYVGGVPPAEAIAMSLAIVGVTSLVAALLHARTGGVAWPTAALFAPAGAAGAFAGARLTYLVDPDVLLALFGSLLLAIGLLMLLRTSARAARRAAATDAEPRGVAVILAAGGAVGVLTGFLGVGGGFVIVPALLFLCRLDIKRAIGTSLVIIATNSAAGLVGHLGHEHIDATATALFVGFATAGAIAGHALAARTRGDRLQRGFAGLVLAVGGAVAAHAIGLLPF